MAIEKDYIRCACDRQPKAHADGKQHVEYMPESSKDVGEWHTVQWVDKNGVTRVMTLCKECFEKYQGILATFQNDMASFENEGL